MDTIEILTTVLVVITAYYAVVTHLTLKANQEAFRASVRPYVSVRAELGTSSVYFLVIENVGSSPASDLKLSIDKPFEILAAPPVQLADTYLFRSGVTVFVPGDRITYGLGIGHDVVGSSSDEERKPRRFKVTASYRFGRKAYTESTEIDLNRYDGIIQYFGPIPGAIQKLTAELKDIRSLLSKKLS